MIIELASFKSEGKRCIPGVGKRCGTCRRERREADKNGGGKSTHFILHSSMDIVINSLFGYAAIVLYEQSFFSSH